MICARAGEPAFFASRRRGQIEGILMARTAGRRRRYGEDIRAKFTESTIRTKFSLRIMRLYLHTIRHRLAIFLARHYLDSHTHQQ